MLNNLQQGKFDEFEMPPEPKFVPSFLKQDQDLLDKLPFTVAGKQSKVRNQSSYNIDLEKKDSEKTQAGSDVTKVPTPKSKSIDQNGSDVQQLTNGSAWS